MYHCKCNERRNRNVLCFLNLRLEVWWIVRGMKSLTTNSRSVIQSTSNSIHSMDDCKFTQVTCEELTEVISQRDHQVLRFHLLLPQQFKSSHWDGRNMNSAFKLGVNRGRKMILLRIFSRSASAPGSWGSWWQRTRGGYRRGDAGRVVPVQP